MKTKIVLLLLAAEFVCQQLAAQIYDTNGGYVQTFAGSGFSGYVDGVGQLTMFNNPNCVVSDSHGNLFVWDSNNYRIRKITPDGTVSTFVGGGNQTTGVGTNVYFGLGINFYGIAIDRNDTLWMPAFDWTSSYEDVIYRITSSGVVTRSNLWSVGGSGSLIAKFQICADSSGNILISYGYANQIYKYTTNGVLSVLAGSGNQGYADGNGIFSAFYSPAGIATDSANNIYVWDSGNHLIRRIDQNQNVTTLAGKYLNGSNLDGVGTNAGFSSVYQMCVDGSGSLILASDNCIRKIDASTNVTTIAGSFSQSGYINGAGNVARFSGASGVCVSSGAIYVAESANQRIRNITNNPAPQVVSPANLNLGTYSGLQITGNVGRTYQIQTSPDLNSWSTKATVLLNSSPYLWIDQNPVSGNKFYRAVLLP